MVDQDDRGNFQILRANPQPQDTQLLELVSTGLVEWDDR
jgi:hypothetical protein